MANSKAGPTGTGSSTAGEASGKHQGLRQPADDQRVEAALDDVGLDDRGESMEDQLRDRRGKGARGGHDEAVDLDRDDQEPAPGDAGRSPSPH